MNLPNMITMGRLVLIPVYVYVFYMVDPRLAFFVLLLAGFSDILDGYLARSRNQVTELGMMLDPLVDKLMLLAVIVTLLSQGMLPWLAAAFMLFRELGMIIGVSIAKAYGKVSIPANQLGKVTAVLIYLVFLMIFFSVDYRIPVLYTVISLSYLSSFIYVGLMMRKNNVKLFGRYQI